MEYRTVTLKQAENVLLLKLISCAMKDETFAYVYNDLKDSQRALLVNLKDKLFRARHVLILKEGK
jgi:hypothetical protein